MYVTDSLFFIQHLLGGGENDPDRQLFNTKYREIIEENDNPRPEETADEIRERMIRKSQQMTGDNK